MHGNYFFYDTINVTQPFEGWSEVITINELFISPNCAGNDVHIKWNQHYFICTSDKAYKESVERRPGEKQQVGHK